MNSDTLESLEQMDNQESGLLSDGHKIFTITHTKSVKTDQVLFAIMRHFCNREDIFAVFTLPDIPFKIFIEVDSSKVQIDQALEHLKFRKSKAEDITDKIMDILIPFKMTPMRPGRIVVLKRPDFLNEIAQIVDTDLQKGTVLVKCWPHIDYANLRRHNLVSQQQLNAKMPRNYKAPRVPFEIRASQGAKDSTIAIYGRDQPCVEWDESKFIGSFRYMWTSMEDVSPRANVSDFSDTDVSTLAASVNEFELACPGFLEKMLTIPPKDYDTESEEIKFMEHTAKSNNHPARLLKCSQKSQEILEISSTEESICEPSQQEIVRQPRSTRPVLAVSESMTSEAPSQVSQDIIQCSEAIVTERICSPDPPTPVEIDVNKSDCDAKEYENQIQRAHLESPRRIKLKPLPYKRFEATVKRLADLPTIFDGPLKATPIKEREEPTFIAGGEDESLSDDDVPIPDFNTKRVSPRDVKNKKIIISKEMQSRLSQMMARGCSSHTEETSSDDDVVKRSYTEVKRATKSPQTSPIRHAPEPKFQSYSQPREMIRRRLTRPEESSDSEVLNVSFSSSSSSSSDDDIMKFVEIEIP